jgi:hypothetical protein
VKRKRAVDLRHILAVLAGLVCFAVVFTYTGDAELLIAISSGLAASAVSYVAASLSIAMYRNRG